MSEAPPVAPTLGQEIRTAAHNSLKLGSSLLITWGVGLLVRFWLPRHLGPEQFGVYSFADGLAAAVIGFVGLGVDLYVQKEIPVRPRHVSDFFAGTTVLRTLLAAALIAVLGLLPLEGRTHDLGALLVVFGLGHFVLTLNGTLAAVLQANTTVNELAIGNVGAKFAWGLGIAAGIWLALPLWALAAVYVASETMKLLYLYAAAAARMGVRWSIDTSATKAVIVASLPFYGNNLIHVLGGRLDVALLGFLVSKEEVGWYGAAQQLAGITLLFAPLMISVLLPLLARTHERSVAELLDLARRSLAVLVAGATPVALLIALGAELWVGLAFGPAFVPATGSVQVLATLLVITYANIVMSMVLVVLGRAWAISGVSIAGIVTSAVAAVLLVPVFSRILGHGGAGTAMALTTLAKELVVAALFIGLLGRGAHDLPLRRAVLRTALAAAGTLAVHLTLAPLGHWRLVADMLAYGGLALALGAVQMQTVARVARELLASRGL